MIYLVKVLVPSNDKWGFYIVHQSSNPITQWSLHATGFTRPVVAGREKEEFSTHCESLEKDRRNLRLEDRTLEEESDQP